MKRSIRRRQSCYNLKPKVTQLVLYYFSDRWYQLHLDIFSSYNFRNAGNYFLLLLFKTEIAGIKRYFGKNKANINTGLV